MDRTYFVRYGMQRHVGRFVASGDAAHRRGNLVVIKTLRGKELGEILAETSDAGDATFPLLHAARPEDLEQARHGEADRLRRFSVCEQFLGDGVWPLDLIDVEPLLDEARTVVYYLGPHRLDTSGLSQAFHLRYGLDTVFQAIGRDEPAEDTGACGSCDGCGSGCGDSGGGCSGCAVKDLVRDRNSAPRDR